MQGTITFKVDPEITEQKLVEYCLNLKASGYDPSLLFFMYAFARAWYLDKLIYYKDLLDSLKTEVVNDG